MRSLHSYSEVGFGRPNARRIGRLLCVVALCGCVCDEGIEDAVARLVVTPSPVDFGDHPIGSRPERALTLRADGNVALRFDGFSIEGPHAQLFDLTGLPEAGTQLSFGASVEIGLGFSPVEEGSWNAVLVIESNDPESPERVHIQARSLSPEIVLCHAVEDPDSTLLDCAESGMPLLLDFGEVAVGDSFTMKALVRNVGNGRLLVEEPLLDEAGAAAGYTPENFPSATSIPRGGGVEIEVRFVGDGGGERTGRVMVRSNDPDHPESFIDLRAGAMPNEPPVACAAAVRTIGIDGRVKELPEPLREIVVRPWDRVFLTAHPSEDCSRDPEDGAWLSYEWRVVETPEGQVAVIENESSGPSPVVTPPEPPPSVYIGGVGRYVVELVVFDSLGAASEPATVVIDAAPDDDLIIELSWDVGVDLDLHLIAPGTSSIDERAFCDPLDCFWDTCTPMVPGIPVLHWGAVGGAIGDDGDPDTDPIIRFDNLGDSVQRGTEDLRLEIVSLLTAPVVDSERGPYYIGVAFFDARGVNEGFSAKVTVIHAGEPLFTSERLFLPEEEGSFWIAGSYDSALAVGQALGGPVFFSPYSGVPGYCE